MLHPEEAEFRRFIFRNHGDDTALLVYADWLQEQGKTEREAFVRALVGCKWLEMECGARQVPAREFRLFLASSLHPVDGLYGAGLATVRRYRGRRNEWSVRAGQKNYGAEAWAVSCEEAKRVAWEYLVCWGGTPREPLKLFVPQLTRATS